MPIVDTDPQAIKEILTRSISKVYPSSDELATLLKSGKRLKVYMGIDPTADYIHLGHSTNYLLLERLHKLGHKIVVLVGDFTAMIGDPSDKSSMRKQLTKEEVSRNLTSFKQQIHKILPLDDTKNPIEFVFNSEWLTTLTFGDSIDLASNFTLQQMVERDAFQKRLASNKPLHLHEFFYPLMQGYDSVALDVDMEIGGTDQTFNMLAGRTLLKRFKNKDKYVITTTLLENPLTGEKLMSKSLGTGVSLNAAPLEMFTKVMRIPDEGVLQCFIDCTRWSMREIEPLNERVRSEPKEVKLLLAAVVTEMYHGKEAARSARERWTFQFTDGNTPADIPSFTIQSSEVDISDILVESKLVSSKSEVRRLLSHEGIKLNGHVVNELKLHLKAGDVLQAGKRKHVLIATK